jgi:hypothetical protein
VLERVYLTVLVLAALTIGWLALLALYRLFRGQPTAGPGAAGRDTGASRRADASGRG